ncbi:DUF4249 family protein, partial [Litoribacter alkaliphilus]
EPEIITQDFGFLVAEGYVELEGKSTLKLGRTVTVYSEQSINPINNATVFLAGSESGSWQFALEEDGTYAMEGTLPSDQDYQLRIQIGEHEQYISDWMQPAMAPLIEGMFFTREEDGVYIYLNSRGEENYFLWTTEETWEYRSWFNPMYRYDPFTNTIVEREKNINLCYQRLETGDIILGSSAQSSSGEIFGVELMRIPLYSEKLGTRYSIEVWQRPIDKDAFEFWESIRKNTEDLGDIFSPLPAFLGSNLKKEGDEDYPVIGYISIGKSEKKRLFVEFVDIMPWSARISDYNHCVMEPDTLQPHQYADYFGRPEVEVGLPVIREGRIIGWNYTFTNCTDCRLRGGTIEKPDYWDNY